MIDYIYAIHVTFMIFWIASLFFIGRMMIYDQESIKKNDTDQKAIQLLCRNAIKRTFVILTWPSLLITLIAGLKLMVIIQAYKFGWFHTKMMFVVLLVFYTIHAYMNYKKMLKNQLNKNSIFLRIYNEIPGILTLMIVFTIYTKNVFSGIYATICLFSIVAIIILIVRKFRSNK